MSHESPADTPYWANRQDYQYYRMAVDLAWRHAPEARTALDVGARDTRFLEWVTWADRKTALDDSCTPRVAGADNIRCDFLTYTPVEQFDLVFCLQVLEHLDRPGDALRKLLQTGRIVVVSVPYKWPAGACEYHTQDPVDELKLQRWAGRRWLESQVVVDEGRERLVAVFSGAAGDTSPVDRFDAVRRDRSWLAPLLAAITAAVVPRAQDRFPSRAIVSAGGLPSALASIAGGPGAYLAKVLWQALGFDDRRALAWRLDHKLIQATVIDHFAPGDPPRTWGLGELLRLVGRVKLIDALLTNALFVKRAVGHLSGDWGEADATSHILRRLWQGEDVNPPSDAPENETWVVQERLRVAHEVRVHSFEDRVVPGLTYDRYGPCRIPADWDQVNNYVQTVLDRLPDGVVGQSLLAWDVARGPDGRFRVIEANFAGTHAVYAPGFQVSGFFQTHPIGPPLMAVLCHHVAQRYNLELELPDRWDGFPARYPRYMRLLRHYLIRPATPFVPPTHQTTIDGVLSVGRDKLPQLKLLLRSIDRFGSGLGRLWIATPEADQAAVAAVAGSHAVVVPEPELVPKATPGSTRAGAIARLALVERTSGRFCFDLTPDVLCVRKFTTANIIPDGRALYYRSLNGPREPYLEVEDTLGLAWPGWSHGSTPFVFCKPVVAALTTHLSSRAGRPDAWREFLLAHPTVSIPLLYFAFLESVGLDDVYYTPTTDLLAGNSVWSADEWPDWDADKSFERGRSFPFSVVRPGPGVPPSEVADRVSPYLT